MAQRDITSYRTVTEQVAPKVAAEQTAYHGPSTINQLANVAADIGSQIIKAGQEAKITENYAKASLEVNQLQQQFEIDNESDPFNKDALEKFKQNRQAVFDKYGSDISPFFKKPYQDNVRELGFKNDAEQEAWGYKQTRVNTVNSINNAMQADLNQAMIDGQNFGNGDQSLIGSLFNFQDSLNKLTEFGDKHLGHETTTQQLENYKDDRLKMWLSGASDTNPLAALRLLEKPEIQASFRDQKHYSEMKDAIETRALKANEITQQKQVLDVLKDSNSLLAQSFVSGNRLSYEQVVSRTEGKSDAVKDYFLKANGFKAHGEALSPDEKIEMDQGVYDSIVELSYLDNPSAEQIAEVQNSVYDAMAKKAITREKGESYLSNILSPAVAAKEEALAQFDIGPQSRVGTEFTLFGSDKGLGFKGLDEAISDFSIPLSVTEAGNERVSAKNDRARRYNNQGKLDLYNLYYEELDKAAKSQGKSIGQLKELPRSEQRQIYNKAQNEAKYNFWTSRYPSTSNMSKENYPGAILTEDGEKIKTGLSSGKSTASISVKASENIPQFKNMEELNAANLPDGTAVMVNGVKGRARKNK